MRRILFIVAAALAYPWAAHANFYWSFESATIDEGESDEIEYVGGAALSTEQAFAGSQSVKIAATNFSQIQVFNDTNTDKWGATPEQGRIETYVRWTGSFLSGAMVFQADGKSNNPGMDTNEGVDIQFRSQGGASDNGFRVSIGWAGGGGDEGFENGFVVNTSGLDMSPDTWYKLTLEWDKGTLDESKTLRLLVDDVERGSSTRTIGNFVMEAIHHLSIGNDTPTSTEFYLDEFRLDALTTTSITRDGVTWHFDQPVRFGGFVNDDPWVLAPVTITQIEPDFDGTNGGSNGWEVNPTVQFDQAFQREFVTSTSVQNTYNAALMPSLPYTASTTQSIVKTIASGINRPCISSAAVLTVLEEIPAANGSTTFRPPYVGTDKPLYTTSDLRTDLLPSVPAAGASVPTLASIVTHYSKCLRLDHHNFHPRFFRPSDAMSDYWPDEWPNVGNAMVRLMCDDPLADKMEALILFTQYALDQTYIVMGGYRQGGDGHNPGHQLIAAWGAMMLDVPGAMTYLETAIDWQESEFLYYSAAAGLVLWGDDTRTDSQYWTYIATSNLSNPSGSKSAADPYRFIDGGLQGLDSSEYQDINSQIYKSQVVIGTIWPALQGAFTHDADPTLDLWSNIVNYAERWVSHGSWTSPDPAAPYNDGYSGDLSGYGVDYGPNPSPPPAYIAGSGRSISFHGSNTDGGQRRQQWIADMWDAYVESAPPAGSITTGTATVGTLNVGP